MEGPHRPWYALLGEAIAHEVTNQFDVAVDHLDLVVSDDDHPYHVRGRWSASTPSSTR